MSSWIVLVRGVLVASW